MKPCARCGKAEHDHVLSPIGRRYCWSATDMAGMSWAPTRRFGKNGERTDDVYTLTVHQTKPVQ